MDEPLEDVIFEKNNKKNEQEEQSSSAKQEQTAIPEKIKKENMLSAVVIAEFNLLSLDSPNAVPKNCEIMTQKPYFMLGRGVNCDYRVTFKDKYVADEQASIAYSIEDESYVIRCLAKENPIFIDNKKVQGDHKLHSGSIIRLGVATNAPKLRFFIEGEEEVQRTHKQLSEILKFLERGKRYSVGGSGENCNITINSPSISGVVLYFHVPFEGNHIILKKDPKCTIPITIDGSNVHVNENRILPYQKTMDIGNVFTLVHDVSKFRTARVPKQCLMSDFIATPERGNVYTIGSGENATFRIEDDNVPFLLAEIDAPLEGDHFVIKKISGNISVSIDNDTMEEDPRNGKRLGVNQILRIGDYLEIRNNHRSLPALKKGFMWTTFGKGAAICLVISFIAVGIIWMVKKYTPDINEMLNPQNTMQLYQKNVFYIATFDEAEQTSIASGTGFLWAQKDAYEKNIYYIVTCKHVIQPWKFAKHKKQGDKYFDEQGKEIKEYSLALWPYNSEVIQPESSSYLLQNSFHNLTGDDKLGSVELYRIADDEYEKDGDFQIHKKNSNGDLAVLKITFNEDKWSYDYRDWKIVSSPQISVGEEVIVLGYSLGGGRLVNKNGIAKPVVCEGKVSSESKAPDFVELDVNQTNGSSGGPILSKIGEIIGIVSFSTDTKNLVYGIHGKILEDLMR